MPPESVVDYLYTQVIEFSNCWVNKLVQYLGQFMEIDWPLHSVELFGFLGVMASDLVTGLGEKLEKLEGLVICQVEGDVYHLIPEKFTVVVLHDVSGMLIIGQEGIERMIVLPFRVLFEFLLGGLSDIDEGTEAVGFPDVDFKPVLTLFNGKIAISGSCVVEHNVCF